MRTPEFLAIILAGSAALSFFLAGCGLSRRSRKGALAFSGFMTTSAIYALGYALELGQRDLPGMIRALNIQYLGIPFICYFWLLFALRFTGLERAAQTLRPILAVPAALTSLLFWTNAWHRLFYTQSWVRPDAPFPLIGVTHGPLYWIHVGLSELELLAGIALFALYARKATHRHRRQAIALVLGSLFPTLVLFAYLLDATPWHLDISPLGTICSGVVFFWALFRMGILELVPAARELAIDALQDGFLVLDRKAVVADANPAAQELLRGIRIREGLPVSDPSGQSPWLGQLIALARGERSQGESGPLEVRVERKGEAPRRLSLEALPVRDSRNRRVGSVVVIRDVTALSALMERLTEMAVTDELTGLFNRRRFQEVGSRELEISRRGERPLAVAIIDVDRFKGVNDRHGHDAGDEALKEVARRLAGSLRAGDVLCRHGGEEFAILLPDSGTEGAHQAAERFRQAVRALPVTCGGVSIPITVSVGFHAAVPAPGDTLESLLARADEALYRAKERGRDRCEAWEPEPCPAC